MAYREGWIVVAALWAILGAGCSSTETTSRENTGPGNTDSVVTGAAFAGGTRLRAAMAETSDGTAVLVHWWDTELNVRCEFEPMEEPDATWRCLPRSAVPIYQGVDDVFADAECSQRLYLAPGASVSDGLLAQVVDVNCQKASEYYRVGTPFTSSIAHYRTEQGCVPRPAPSPDDRRSLFTMTLLPMQTFVAAKLVADESPGPVAHNYLSADDGSRAPHGLSDVGGGFDCWPRQTSEGTRCLPSHFGWGDRGGVYADARCSLPAASPEKTCGERRSTLPFVLFEGPSGTGGITAVHRGGAQVSAPFVQVGADCSQADPETVAFAIGQPLELGSFLPASLRRASRSSGFVQTVAEVDTVAVARFDQLATDLFGGYECTLATPSERDLLSDGTVRCVPPASSYSVGYSDARCTQPVWETASERISFLGDTVELEAPGAGGAVLPRVIRVLTGGTRYDGPVYTRQTARCTLDPNLPNARQPYSRFSDDVRLADLPELSIVVR